MTIDPEQPKSYAYCSDLHTGKIINLLKELIYYTMNQLFGKERGLKTFHSTAADAARIAKQAHVGKLILSHFSNRYKDKTAFWLKQNLFSV